jgi:hypothetical protein
LLHICLLLVDHAARQVGVGYGWFTSELVVGTMGSTRPLVGDVVNYGLHANCGHGVDAFAGVLGLLRMKLTEHVVLQTDTINNG